MTEITDDEKKSLIASLSTDYSELSRIKEKLTINLASVTKRINHTEGLLQTVLDRETGEVVDLSVVTVDTSKYIEDHTQNIKISSKGN